MRVGIVTSSFGAGGGMEHYAADLARSALANGDTPVVFCKKAVPGLAARLGVTCFVMPCGWMPRSYRDRYFSWRLERALAACPVDLSIGCYRNRVTDIITCGGTHAGDTESKRRRPTWFDRVTIAFDRRAYAACRVVVAHSRRVAEELTRLCGVPPEKIRLLYPPVNGEIFRPAADPARKLALRRKHGLPERERLVLFPSMDHRRKGLDMILRALASSEADVRIVVAGKKVPGCPPRVISLGYRDDMTELYQACDYTMLASAYEPFGLVAVESLLCGTPVILRDTVGAIEVISGPGLITFSGPDELAAILARIAVEEPVRPRDPERCVGSPLSPLAHYRQVISCLTPSPAAGAGRRGA